MARILVIDDENNIRMMIRLALQHDGHTVETAADGPDGLEKFGDGQGWDLALLDQRMPGMEGLEVLRQMRQRDPDTRIIMITAFGTIDLAVDAMKAGATDFLRKPFTAEILRGAVRAVLQSSAPPPDSPLPTVYHSTTVNGFRFAYVPAPGARSGGDLRYEFMIESPTGQRRPCAVVLPGYLVELVKAHLDCETPPGGDRFWQALCEEALANYVWQHAEFPPEDGLRLDDLTTGLRRWIDAVLGAVTAA